MHSNSAPTSRPRTSYLATLLHGRGKWLVAGVAGASLALVPLSVFAHSVVTVQGTVNCSGQYSITATGDVYDGHRLIVDLNGVQIENIVENGSTASQTFGPFTGSGATAGESIAANADNPNGTQESAPVHNTLTASPTVCPTPTPTPTATPTPTPYNTPTPTPTPTTPIVPRTPTTPTTGSGLLLPGIIGLLAVIGGLSLLAIDRKLSYKKN